MDRLIRVPDVSSMVQRCDSGEASGLFSFRAVGLDARERGFQSFDDGRTICMFFDLLMESVRIKTEHPLERLELIRKAHLGAYLRNKVNVSTRASPSLNHCKVIFFALFVGQVSEYRDLLHAWKLFVALDPLATDDIPADLHRLPLV